MVARYVSLNRARTHCAIMPYSSKKFWRIANCSDVANTGNDESYYACPLRFVFFEKLMWERE